MNFDYGTWIAIGAVLLFYLRLIILQRQKAKQASLSRAGKKKNVSTAAPGSGRTAPTLLVNRPLAIAGVLIILAGAAFAGLPALSSLAHFWWLPVTVGIAVMGLSFH